MNQGGSKIQELPYTLANTLSSVCVEQLVLNHMLKSLMLHSFDFLFLGCLGSTPQKHIIVCTLVVELVSE